MPTGAIGEATTRVASGSGPIFPSYAGLAESRRLEISQFCSRATRAAGHLQVVGPARVTLRSQRDRCQAGSNQIVLTMVRSLRGSRVKIGSIRVSADALCCRFDARSVLA